MGRRSTTGVHFYLEDGFLVRGTLDPVTALGLAVDHDDSFEIRYDAADCGRRDDTDPGPDEVAALADLCHELISTARPGLYRINVAGPDHWDGYAWFTGRATRPGRGVFEGVEFHA